MRTSPLRRPENGAEVVWVFDSIQDHEQWWLLSSRRTIHDLFLSLIGFCRSKRDNALVFAIGDQTVQGGEGLNMNGDLARAGQLDKIRKLFVGSQNEDSLEWPIPCFQRFAYGMEAVQDLLSISASSGLCHQACPQ
jgi:hypothetical protein